ncbi:hypothetical protein NRZ29_11835 [Aeromonas hydrophila]|uniref:hypothetical protein n=1 Tax=Aeromonas hydrophila TaxID=644 RepID=UPI00227C3C0A|nr:hypothetical protein [Aeromonas hydrophila]WAG13821.1 hypothetical protein NRZ29_11835 [Aeromonas hydrophila]
MKKIPIATLFMTSLSGCSIFSGTANRFESNSVVGYIPPLTTTEATYEIRNGSTRQPIQNPNIVPSNANQTKVLKDDCIVVDLVGGYINQTFEDSLEKALSSTPRSEITLAIAVYERMDSTNINKKPEDRYPSSAEYNVLSTIGQLSHRPLSFENVPIYGPRKYEGGDIVFHLSMVELDEEEADNLKSDITNQTKKLSTHLPDESKNISIHSTALKAMTGATFTMSGVGLVTLGINAVETFADIYTKINREDDLIMNHTFSLTSQYRTSEIHSPILRVGYYPIVRLSTKESYPQGLVNAAFDPIAPSLKMGNPQVEPIWVAFRVSKTSSCK